MNVGIIDADLIGRKKHTFPNLASMKISAYNKRIGNNVELITDYNNLNRYDQIYLSKVFTDTQIPENILKLHNVKYGGTGFFYDKAPPLPYEIEHIMPDYHLYDDYVNEKIKSGKNKSEYKWYTDYSIGFLTRGCFRHCQFCVNRNYNSCEKHSDVNEFLDITRPKICLLDDNFFACPQWFDISQSLKHTNKPITFRQGLDERLLDDQKINEMMSWKYDGDVIFAFDDINDKNIIASKIKRIRQLHPDSGKRFKFYVLCGFDRNDKYNDDFWLNDLRNTFERIWILASLSCAPYIMRYNKVYTSEYSGIYSAIAQWCNQRSIFNTFSFEMFCKCKGMNSHYKKYKRDIDLYMKEVGNKGAAWRYYDQLVSIAPDIINKYCLLMPTKQGKGDANGEQKEKAQ